MGDALISDLAEQLLEAVNHLHNHRIVHRDIKADNVMIRRRESDGKMQFVLIDFGCALDCIEDEFDGFQMPFPVRGMSKGGAPMYLAPEVARAKAGRGQVRRGGMHSDEPVLAAPPTTLQLYHTCTSTHPFSNSLPPPFPPPPPPPPPTPHLLVRLLTTPRPTGGRVGCSCTASCASGRTCR
jgi:serine/threonine protein kinase